VTGALDRGIAIEAVDARMIVTAALARDIEVLARRVEADPEVLNIEVLIAVVHRVTKVAREALIVNDLAKADLDRLAVNLTEAKVGPKLDPRASQKVDQKVGLKVWKKTIGSYQER